MLIEVAESDDNVLLAQFVEIMRKRGADVPEWMTKRRNTLRMGD
jgi:hypothetical protein